MGRFDRRRSRRRTGSPRWYDPDSTKECDHSTEEYPPEKLRSYVGYSDFGYYKSRCGHPECDETWCWYIEG